MKPEQRYDGALFTTREALLCQVITSESVRLSFAGGLLCRADGVCILLFLLLQGDVDLLELFPPVPFIRRERETDRDER